MLSKCGGTLASWSDRWLAPNTGEIAIPEITDPRVTAVATLKQITYTLGDVLFDVDSATLRTDAGKRVEQVKTSIKKRGSTDGITVVGFTDDTGSRTHNHDLSVARAQAVAHWLVEHKVAAERNVTPDGHGEDDPVSPNDTPAGRAANRRPSSSR